MKLPVPFTNTIRHADHPACCRKLVLALILCAGAAAQPPAVGVAAADGAGAAKSPSEGGPRRWEVSSPNITMHAAPAISASVVKKLDAGVILSNLGCEQVDGDTWCAVRTLRGRTRGFVQGRYVRPATGPDGVVPVGPDISPARARDGSFDAEGEITCAQEQGQPLTSCRFAVARGNGGDATVVVTFANGFKRTLFFRHGQFVRADTTMSGNGFDTDWRTEDGLHVIRVDDQQYRIPHAAIFHD